MKSVHAEAPERVHEDGMNNGMGQARRSSGFAANTCRGDNRPRATRESAAWRAPLQDCG
jgi:hypothetical protein